MPNIQIKIPMVAVALGLMAVLAGGCSWRTVEIPRSTVQKKIDKKFPLEKNVLVANASLTDPNVYLADDEVGIRLKLKASFLNKQIKGTADIRGTVVYRHEDKKFYVENLYIVDMKAGRLKLNDLGKLKSVVERIIEKHLKRIAVYTMDESKRKERFAATRIKSIEVDEERDMVIIKLGRKHRSDD